MAKKDIDWANIGFGYRQTDYRYVSNYKNGAWDVGGVMTMEYDEEGHLEFRVIAADDDFDYDEIGSELKIRQYQTEKRELLESLELFYRVFFKGEKFEDIKA